MTASTTQPSYDLKNTLTPNRLVGLWRMMTGFKLVYLGATLGLSIATVARTGTAYLIRYLIDEALPRDDFGGDLPFIALGFVGLALVQGSFTFMSGRWAAHTAEGIARRLRNYIYDHLQRLSFTYHDQAKTGELVQRASSDVDTVRRFYAEQAIGFGRISLLFIINFIGILTLNVKLAFISVVIVPVNILASYLFFKRLMKVYEEYQEQDAVVSTRIQENLSGVRVVKAFARQDYEIDKFETENWKKFTLGRRYMRMHSFYWPLSDILSAGQMLAGFTIGALMAINGEITVGTYLAYAGMVVLIIWPMRMLGRLIVQMSSGLVSFKRVSDIIQEEREPMTAGDHLPDGDLRGEVVFDKLNFAYDEESPVLNDINLHCQPGQAIALLGSTGSGKTSLVNLLPRFYEYTDGSLTLDGVELNRYPRHYLRKQIGIVEQEPFLFSRTIRENIAFGVDREVSDEEIEAAARAAAIHEVVESFPEGYNTLVGEKGVTLSGGQKQRVAIARTLLKDPRILILDDSTSSVDTETEAVIRAALRTLMEGRTTFIIAHRIQSVMNADQILVLDKGEIVQRGVHEELLKDEEGIYRRIFDLQARIEDELEKELARV